MGRGKPKRSVAGQKRSERKRFTGARSRLSQREWVGEIKGEGPGPAKGSWSGENLGGFRGFRAGNFVRGVAASLVKDGEDPGGRFWVGAER